MNPQYIETESGEKLVVLSLQGYEALVEQASDQGTFDPTQVHPASKRNQPLRADVAARLADGASPVKVWREFRGLKAKDLAATVGISAAYLSQIETGERMGSMKVIVSLAQALDVSTDELT